MKKTLIATAVAGLCLLSAGTATADDAHDGMPAMGKDEPAAAPPPNYFFGHIDIGYPGLSGNGKFINGLNDRVFDFDRSSVVLHAVDLQLMNMPQNGFGGLVEVTLGKDADTIAAYGTIDRARGPANGVNKRGDLTQAYGYYGAGSFSIIVGKYVTLAGAEVIKSDSDVNYSRSILFGYAIPFTHTGVRATYKVNDKLTLIGGVNNGWDAVSNVNGDRTLEWGLSYNFTDALSLAVQGYDGKQRLSYYPQANASGPKGTRDLIDALLTYKANDKLTFVVNYDYGSQKNAPLINGSTGTANWEGWAGYTQYQFNDQWRLVLRGEIFDDKDGYRTVVAPGSTSGQKWKEATLTLAYLPTKNIEVRAEVRGDKSDQSVFLKSNGVNASKDQTSLGMEFLYKF